MKHTTQQKGFTLIEMLIVIAIVGILSAVALPIYQQYIARSQLKEGVSLGMSAQPLIEDYIHRTGGFPATTDLAALGLPTNATGGILGTASATIDTVTTVPGVGAASGTGTITVLLRTDLRPEVSATTIVYTKTPFTAVAGVVTDPGSWNCNVTFPTAAAADMDLMPEGCL